MPYPPGYAVNESQLAPRTEQVIGCADSILIRINSPPHLAQPQVRHCSVTRTNCRDLDQSQYDCSNSRSFGVSAKSSDCRTLVTHARGACYVAGLVSSTHISALSRNSPQGMDSLGHFIVRRLHLLQSRRSKTRRLRLHLHLQGSSIRTLRLS